MNRREPALTIKLTGPSIGEGRLALAEVVHVGRNLQVALERIALVLRGEAKSLKPGRRPADVTGLCRFDLVGFRGGSAILELELSGAERPFEIMDLGEAALDRMVEGLQRVSEGSDLARGLGYRRARGLEGAREHPRPRRGPDRGVPHEAACRLGRPVHSHRARSDRPADPRSLARRDHHRGAPAHGGLRRGAPAVPRASLLRPTGRVRVPGRSARGDPRAADEVRPSGRAGGARRGAGSRAGGEDRRHRADRGPGRRG